jgi:hypothetical protein
MSTDSANSLLQQAGQLLHLGSNNAMTTSHNDLIRDNHHASGITAPEGTTSSFPLSQRLSVPRKVPELHGDEDDSVGRGTATIIIPNGGTGAGTVAGTWTATGGGAEPKAEEQSAAGGITSRADTADTDSDTVISLGKVMMTAADQEAQQQPLVASTTAPIATAPAATATATATTFGSLPAPPPLMLPSLPEDEALSSSASAVAGNQHTYRDTDDDADVEDAFAVQSKDNYKDYLEDRERKRSSLSITTSASNRQLGLPSPSSGPGSGLVGQGGSSTRNPGSRGGSRCVSRQGSVSKINLDGVNITLPEQMEGSQMQIRLRKRPGRASEARITITRFNDNKRGVERGNSDSSVTLIGGNGSAESKEGPYGDTDVNKKDNEGNDKVHLSDGEDALSDADTLKSKKANMLSKLPNYDVRKRFVTSYIMRHTFFVMVSLFICAFSEDFLLTEDPVGFNIFYIIFEVVSAYTNVGLSMGAYGSDGLSFSMTGAFGVIGKLAIMATMLLGKFRGLPKKNDIVIDFKFRHFRKLAGIARKQKYRVKDAIEAVRSLPMSMSLSHHPSTDSHSHININGGSERSMSFNGLQYLSRSISQARLPRPGQPYYPKSARDRDRGGVNGGASAVGSSSGGSSPTNSVTRSSIFSARDAISASRNATHKDAITIDRRTTSIF